MSVTVGYTIGIGLLLYNAVCVDVCGINGSVGHEACYFYCKTCGKWGVSFGRCIGLVVSFCIFFAVLSCILSGCGGSSVSFIRKKVTLEMFHSVLCSFLSYPGPACFGKQSGFVNDGKTGTNDVDFSDVVISWNGEDYCFFDLYEQGHNGCGWSPLLFHLKEILIQLCRCNGTITGL